MNSYLDYLLEANIGLLLFLLFYVLVLDVETNFAFKRAYLLGGLAASLLFPLVTIATPQGGIPTVAQLLPPNWLPEIVVFGQGVKTPEGSSPPVWPLIVNLYWGGVAIFATRFLWQCLQLAKQLKTNKVMLVDGKYKVTEVPGNFPTFSFFRRIYIGNTEALSAEERAIVVCHERVHADLFHSIDILFVEVLRIVCWFNPAVYFYKKIFTNVHEFQADARAVEHHDVNQYCSLLAKVALMSADFKLANHFNNSLTLKRINMMKTIKKKMHGWKVAAVILFVAGFFLAVACQDQALTKETEVAKVSSDALDVPQEVHASEDGEVFTIVEQSAEPAGGFESVVDVLRQNLSYPNESRMKGVEGTVFVQFVVNQDGSLSNFSIKKGVNAALDNEALRVAQLLPAWKPGKQNGRTVRQQFVLPVSFRLDASAPIGERAMPLEKRMKVTSTIVQHDGKTLVQGSVTDDAGNPMPGSNIVIVGGSRGTTTDLHGRFALDVGNAKGQLSVSFVGYKPELVSF